MVAAAAAAQLPSPPRLSGTRPWQPCCTRRRCSETATRLRHRHQTAVRECMGVLREEGAWAWRGNGAQKGHIAGQHQGKPLLKQPGKQSGQQALHHATPETQSHSQSWPAACHRPSTLQHVFRRADGVGGWLLCMLGSRHGRPAPPAMLWVEPGTCWQAATAGAALGAKIHVSGGLSMHCTSPSGRLGPGHCPTSRLGSCRREGADRDQVRVPSGAVREGEACWGNCGQKSAAGSDVPPTRAAAGTC